MNTYTNLSTTEKQLKVKQYLTIGTFDGIHIGHRAILKKITEQAKADGYESMVLTFFPHPRMVLQQDFDIKLLNTIAEKQELLEEMGIDNLVIYPFDTEFSKLSAEEFVKNILVEKLNAGKIIVGYDHRFGRNRTATITDLKNFGTVYNFEVEQISAEEINSVAVSSTKIRSALETGNIAVANSYLGYEYFISGTVIQGKQLGRTIGFPTANISVPERYKLIPKNGVYAVSAVIDGKTVLGMLNVGVNPTVEHSENLKIEVHFLDFSGDLYGKTLKIHFLEHIRDEKKFGSIEELKTQLNSDRLFSLEFSRKK